MKCQGLRCHYREVMNVLGVIGLLTLEACTSLPQLPTLPNLSTSSSSDSKALMTRGPKKRIAVMRFDSKARETYAYQQVDVKVTDMLTTALVNSGEFIVVDRSTLDKVFKEQSLGLGGFIDPSTATEVGKVLGVQALVTGAVTHIGIENKSYGVKGVGAQITVTNVDLDIRLIDTTTAAILMASTGKGSNSVPSLKVSDVGSSKETADRSESIGKAVREAVDDAARKTIAQMQKVEWTGLIAGVTGKNVYINAGEDLGLKNGSSLTVFRVGTVIKDPATGQVLGKEEQPIGQLLITQVRERLAVAEAQSGSGFAKNDMVRLVKQ